MAKRVAENRCVNSFTDKRVNEDLSSFFLENESTESAGSHSVAPSREDGFKEEWVWRRAVTSFVNNDEAVNGIV